MGSVRSFGIIKLGDQIVWIGRSLNPLHPVSLRIGSLSPAAVRGTDGDGTGTAREFGLTDLPRLLGGREGWAGLRAALAAGQSGTIDGAWGSAAAAASRPGRRRPGPVLVVVPALADLGPWAEDLASFTGTRPAVFPALETWPPPTVRGRIATRRPTASGSCNSSSPPTRRSWCWPRWRRSCSRSRRGRAGRQRPAAARRRRARPRRAGRLAGGERLQAGRGGRDARRVQPPRRHPRRVLARRRRPGPARVLRRRGRVDPHVLAADAAEPGDEGEIVVLARRRTAHAEPTRRRSAGLLTDYLPPGAWVVAGRAGRPAEQGKALPRAGRRPDRAVHRRGHVRAAHAAPERHRLRAAPAVASRRRVHLRVESVERFSGNVQRVRDELDAVAPATAC